MSLDLVSLLPTGGRLSPEAVANEVYDRYREPGRYYHTLGHAEDVVAKVIELGVRLEPAQRRAALLAAWFHDAVYNSRSKTNEEDSAVLATTRLLGLGGKQILADRVAELVLLTKHHTVDEEDQAGAILLDADLSIVGAGPETYQRYAAAIRKEYAWVEEDIYRAQRAQILEAFLARPSIFHTTTMRIERESQARENLAAEIDQLRS